MNHLNCPNGGGKTSHKSIQRTGPKKSKKGKKNKRKTRNKSKGFQYPLRVKFLQLKDPVCFNMYDQALERAPGMYSFYSDLEETGLKVDVKLEKAMLGKWTKQGRVKEIHLTVGDIHEKITSDSLKNASLSTDSGAPWNISLIYRNKTHELKVELEGFTLVITNTEKDYLDILVKGTMLPTGQSGTGIIGQVFGKKFKVVRTITKPAKKNRKGKQTPQKEMVILKVDKTKMKILKKTVQHFTADDTEKCFPLNKYEAKLVDIKRAQHTI
ncbi:uncharacterized protein LOC132729606 [Ruditapes philippinarum]|uniref:uncharacterized protein LOC132729606 n=1 Tax=Ruditapes philippinarum TaxID=129788 RepID=UPI00295B3198|nr:uncharacterized protein LOC132729606 [Ruditapes philippinarum]